MNRGDRFRRSSGAGPLGAYLARGRAPMRVGNALYHTVGDRETAIRGLATEFSQLYGELANQVGVVPIAGSAERVKRNPVWFQWWTSTAEPMFNAWIAFRREALGDDPFNPDASALGPQGTYNAWVSRFEMPWGDIEAWRLKLIALRAAAMVMGFKVKSPARSSGAGPLGAYLARGRAPTAVGAVYSRTDALESLALSYEQTYADLAPQIGIVPGHDWARGEGHTDVLLRDAQGKIQTGMFGRKLYGDPIPEAGGNPVMLQWWNSTAKPTFDAWNIFRQDLLGDDLTVANDYIHWTERMKLTRETLEGWRDRLLGVRQGARLVGMKISTPDPAPLPKTLIDNVEDFGGNVLHKADEAWTFAKIALYGGLVIGAGLAISSIVTHMRAGSDPATPYLQLAGRRK